ncbi:uncharacterized protein [Prorops nasuta]|uniref:uncharacterized protein n=1 Tax=Prorops nasuta TaxID=863751 RepID=UPI0034CE7730
MENVYVIKVKTKPALTSLYPSERRYSASTVGGLSLVHFGLGALSLLLGTLALSVQGPILCVACLVSFVAGLLAWRRWYINRNIHIFFYANVLSLIIASLCFVATIFDIAAVTETNNTWSLEKILNQDQFSMKEFPKGLTNRSMATVLRQTFDSHEQELTMRPIDEPETSTFNDLMNNPVEDPGSTTQRTLVNSQDDDVFKAEASLVYERKMVFQSGESFQAGLLNNGTGSNRSVDTISDKVLSFWQRSEEASTQTKVLLTVNVLVASLLEAFWSLLSARIALRGMLNRLSETDYSNNVPAYSKADAVTGGQRKKHRAPKPDILDHHHGIPGNLRTLTALGTIPCTSPSLPSAESNREFRERVERFLANQAAHRVVEGSCT